MVAKWVKRPDGIEFADAVQEAAVIAWNVQQNWSPECGVPFGTWMWVRTLGDTRDRYKTAWRRQIKGPNVISISDLGNAVHRGKLGDWDLDEPVQPEARELPDPHRHDDLHAAVAELTPKQRAVIDSVFFRGQTQQDTADDMGISQPAVCQILDRATAALKDKLRTP